MGTGTYAPRRTRASQPDLDHAARRRAATSGVSPRAAAAWVGVTMGGLSRSSLLNWLRDVALRPAGRMRYILSEKTSSMMTFLRSAYSFLRLLARLTGPQLDRRASDQIAPFKRLHRYQAAARCPKRIDEISDETFPASRQTQRRTQPESWNTSMACGGRSFTRRRSGRSTSRPFTMSRARSICPRMRHRQARRATPSTSHAASPLAR